MYSTTKVGGMDKRWRELWRKGWEPWEPKPEHRPWVAAIGILMVVLGLILIFLSGGNFWVRFLGSSSLISAAVPLGAVLRKPKSKNQ
jgi:hypothetical protein